MELGHGLLITSNIYKHVALSSICKFLEVELLVKETPCDHSSSLWHNFSSTPTESFEYLSEGKFTIKWIIYRFGYIGIHHLFNR